MFVTEQICDPEVLNGFETWWTIPLDLPLWHPHISWFSVCILL